MCQRFIHYGRHIVMKQDRMRVDKSALCIGCYYCVAACPFHVRYLNPQTGVADKCNFCADTRLAAGRSPACVSVLRLTDALKFGSEWMSGSTLGRFRKVYIASLGRRVATRSVYCAVVKGKSIRRVKHEYYLGAELHYAPDYWPLWLIYARRRGAHAVGLDLHHALLRQCWHNQNGGAAKEHRDYLLAGEFRRWHWGNALLFVLILLKAVYLVTFFSRPCSANGTSARCGLPYWLSGSGFVLINLSPQVTGVTIG